MPDDKKKNVVLSRIEAAGQSGCSAGELITTVNEWVDANPDEGVSKTNADEMKDMLAQLEASGAVRIGEDGVIRLAEQQ